MKQLPQAQSIPVLFIYLILCNRVKWLKLFFIKFYWKKLFTVTICVLLFQLREFTTREEVSGFRNDNFKSSLVLPYNLTKNAIRSSIHTLVMTDSRHEPIIALAYIPNDLRTLDAENL